MKRLESIVKEFDKNFHKKDVKADYFKKVIDFNVYFTGLCVPFLDQEGFSESLVYVKQKFESIFELSFSYRFFPIQDVKPLPAIIKSYKKLRYKHPAWFKPAFLDKYKSMDELSKSLYDYFAFIEQTDNKSESGLHCIVSGLKGYKSKKYRNVGVSLLGRNYLILSLYDKFQYQNKRGKKNLKKTLMHEISHCFGANHSKNPLSIMHHQTKHSFLLWSTNSKEVIKQGINKSFPN